MDHGHEGAMLAAVPLKIGGVPLGHNGEHFGAVGHPLGYREGMSGKVVIFVFL